MDYIPDKSRVDVTNVEIDNDTREMLKRIGMQSVKGFVRK